MKHDQNELTAATTAPRRDEYGLAAGADLQGFRERSLQRGVNPFVYWTVRAILVPTFLVYLRMQRTRSPSPSCAPRACRSRQSPCSAQSTCDVDGAFVRARCVCASGGR